MTMTWLLLAAAAVGSTAFWYSWKRRRDVGEVDDKK
jgi:LPXTG-motif cell wall-anchored protein